MTKTKKSWHGKNTTNMSLTTQEYNNNSITNFNWQFRAFKNQVKSTNHQNNVYLMTRQQNELGVEVWKFDGGLEYIHVGREVSEGFGIKSPQVVKERSTSTSTEVANFLL